MASLPDFGELIKHQQETPKVRMVLESTQLRFNVTPDRTFVILEFIPEGFGMMISIPWSAPDFRMMINGWLKALQEFSDNGHPAESED